MDTLAYVDAIKKRHGVNSDYAVAKLIGIETQVLSNWRAERSRMDSWACYRVAELLEIDPQIVIANIERAKAKSPKKIEYWESWLRRAGAAVSTILISPETPKKRAVGRSSGSDSNFTNYKLYMLGIPPGQDTSKPV